MCYQKRLVYGHCNHSVPLGMAAPCPDKTECEGTRTHPLKTVRVEQMCPACKEKKVRVDNNLTTIAEKIRRLREELSKRGFGGTGSSTCSGPGSGVTCWVWGGVSDCCYYDISRFVSLCPDDAY